MTNARGIFLTGITGTLGREMLRELIQRPENRLFLLVRAGNRNAPLARLEKIMEELGLSADQRQRVAVLEGDITQPGFGLKAGDMQRLLAEVQVFYHVAALTQLNGSKEDCERINVGGTLAALEIAKRLVKEGRLERFFYFSTAYAAGSRQKYHSREDALPEHPVFANFYESSKYASETNVRKAFAAGLPGAIFRPSIVVGHSETGEVSQFNVIYPFMRLFAHGMLRILPTRLENSFNIVPIDFVVKAALAISQKPECTGKTFHLVTRNPPAIETLIRVKKEDYPGMADPLVVAPSDFRREDLEPAEQFIYDMLQPYLGYLNDDLTFDTTNTAAFLAGTGVEFPKTDAAFLRTLLRYAVGQGYLVV